MRIGSLCSGYGGLDLAAERVFGAARMAWCADTTREGVAVTDSSAPDDPERTPCHTSPLEPEHYCSTCGAYNPDSGDACG